MGGPISNNNLAWNAHRTSSVKPRSQQRGGGTGSETNIGNNGIKPPSANEKVNNMRPGTAPKQALMNNFAGGGQKGERPLSPYSKVYS